MERAGKLVEDAAEGELAAKVSRCRMQITGLSQSGMGLAFLSGTFLCESAFHCSLAEGRKGERAALSSSAERVSTAEQVGRDC